MNELTVAIMAGGKSSRMGTDKAFVPLLGMPMIEHVLKHVDGLGHETTIITNRPGDYVYRRFCRSSQLARPVELAVGPELHDSLIHKSGGARQQCWR